jgi:hypothetical protein
MYFVSTFTRTRVISGADCNTGEEDPGSYTLSFVAFRRSGKIEQNGENIFAKYQKMHRKQLIGIQSVSSDICGVVQMLPQSPKR